MHRICTIAQNVLARFAYLVATPPAILLAVEWHSTPDA